MITDRIGLHSVLLLVSFAAVIRVVTQRFSPTNGGEALRDDPNNGCEGDYPITITNGFPALRI